MAGIFAIGGEGTIADLVQRGAIFVGTPVVHIESLAGLPLHLVGDLKIRNLATVLSMHDFTLFCRRPHLMRTATGEFCGYCPSSERCDESLQDLASRFHRHTGGLPAYRRRWGSGALLP